MNQPGDRSTLLARSWDEAADGYEAYFVPRFEPWVGTAVTALAAGPLPDGPILVPCCGTFPELEALARLDLGREIVGIDLSPGMVVRARARAERLGHPVAVVEGDAIALEERWTGACAGVLSVFGLQQLPEPAAALRSWAAALRPSGRLSVLFWPEVPETDGPFVQIERAAGVFTGDDAWEHPLHPTLTATGLLVERDERIAHPISHADAATFFDAYTQSGPMRALANARGAAFVRATRRRFLAAAPSGVWQHSPAARLIAARRR